MWLLILIEYLYLNGIQFGVAPRTKYQKNICLEEIELHGLNMITIISITLTGNTQLHPGRLFTLNNTYS